MKETPKVIDIREVVTGLVDRIFAAGGETKSCGISFDRKPRPPFGYSKGARSATITFATFTLRISTDEPDVQEEFDAWCAARGLSAEEGVKVIDSLLVDVENPFSAEARERVEAWRPNA